MRYINKEYGFAFRPPFTDNFHEESPKGDKIVPADFPGKYKQGVGYDYSAINGAMLVGKHGSLWGIRVSYLKGNKWLDNDHFISHMGGGSANTEDGTFAHFTSGALSVKWVKHNDQSMILQVSARQKQRVRVICYPCFGFSGELSIEGGIVQGRSPHVAIKPGTVSLTDSYAVFKDRQLVICDSMPEKEYFYAKSYNTPSDSANGAFNEAIMEFVINQNQPSVYIYAGVGDDTIFESELPPLHKVAKQIETAELRYGVDKTMGSGVLGAPTERMLNSVLWSRIYYPFLMQEIYMPKRSVVNNHFNINGTEENCSAILGSVAGVDIASNQIKYTIEDKILSLLSVWSVYMHSTDKSGLKDIYADLIKLYPPISELVVTSGADKNEVAYGWNDSPLKEIKNGTSAMFSLDMSCIRLLAFDILERIASMFSFPEKKAYEKAKKEMIQRINDTFWNEQDGIYLNRYTTGQWPFSYGATSFYPLIAGAVDTGEKMSRLINHLLDPRKFWVRYVVPTLSATDREYGSKGRANNNGHRNSAFLEYRGSIVPYVNYIIYQGLARYGLDEIAGNMAERSAKLWANNESDNIENYSMYLPNGKRYKNKKYLSTNGNMLALLGMQELIDLEYFRADNNTNAIRFGTLVEGEHSLTNFTLLGKNYSVDVNDTSTMLIIDKVPVFRGDGGKFKVRNFLPTKDGYEFMIDAHANITINIQHKDNKQLTKYFLIVPVGKSLVRAERGMVSINPI